MVKGAANDLFFHLLLILMKLSVITKMRIYTDAMKINPMDWTPSNTPLYFKLFFLLQPFTSSDVAALLYISISSDYLH